MKNKWFKCAVVLLSGCVLTEVLKRVFGVSLGDVPFIREALGMWLGPALTGWSINEVMREPAEKKKAS